MNEYALQEEMHEMPELSCYETTDEEDKLLGSESTDEACEGPSQGPKIKRASISIKDKERIVNAYENGEDYFEFGRLLGIKQKSIKDIVFRYKRTGLVSLGKAGGHRKPLFSEEIGDALLAFLDVHYDATLKEMQKFLSDTHQILPSLVTISKFLRGKYITMKKLRYSVVGKNSDEVKERRKTYVENYLESGWKSSQCIYMDETGINAWMHRRYGRSKMGTRQYHRVCTSRGPNISLALAISKKGPIYSKAILGSFKRHSYQDFAREVSLRLPATVHYLIHDNASAHNDTLTTTEMHKIIHLPPYSPCLNPIEMVFNTFKSKLRKKLSEINMEHMSSIAKCKTVDDLAKEILSGSDFQNLSNYYCHIKTFFPACLLKKDIL